MVPESAMLNQTIEKQAALCRPQHATGKGYPVFFMVLKESVKTSVDFKNDTMTIGGKSYYAARPWLPNDPANTAKGEQTMSPHFGLMDETRMSPSEAMQMRAKLHWRCGKRRVVEEKAPEGIATLYDALLSSIRWRLLTGHLDELGDGPEEKLEDDQLIISILRKSGVLGKEVDLTFIEQTTERALQGEDVSAASRRFLEQVQELLTALELLPFDESTLPPEDPNTL